MDSLAQAEFNAPYDVIFRLIRFSAILDFVKNTSNVSPPRNFHQSAQNSVGSISIPLSTRSPRGLLIFASVRSLHPIENGGEAAKQEVWPYLSNALMYQKHNRYTHQGPSHDLGYQVSCRHLKHSSATNMSNLEVHLRFTVCPIFKVELPLYSLDQPEFNAPYEVIATILDCPPYWIL